MAADSPPDLFDTTTIVSLLSTVAIVLVAYLASRSALPPKTTTTTTTVRFLFIWHLADALCHFVLEGSFLYHCFFSFIEPEPGAEIAHLFPTPSNYLGNRRPRIYGPQSGGDRNPFAQLWMVYARADKRWAGIDLVRHVHTNPKPNSSSPLPPLLIFSLAAAPARIAFRGGTLPPPFEIPQSMWEGKETLR
ncbi:Emopamil-binding protein [Moelleriella libera RCEF 2490]|uniref:Emopamil-binding protein n=1 Tax=Moelleriella libera RCEF 2490 TaxID=1081109 RepID=A0A168CEW3_9HYPO|nr:Emopamil-binding protein [Moelleriella libera RCEF 2490]